MVCFIGASANDTLCNQRITLCSKARTFTPGGPECTMENSPVKIDTLLEPLLLEASDERADKLLLQLITVHAEPVIRGIIGYKLHLSFHRADQRSEADDIYQEVLVQLLTELNQLREDPDEHPISDVRGMAAVIAHRTCSRWMRRQFPQRHSLKNRLQYLLTHQRGFALWQDENGRLVAGFAVWQGQRKAAPAARLEGLSQDAAVLAHIRWLKSGKQQQLGEALAAIFNHLGDPIGFDELVSALGGLLGIKDQPIESIDQNEDAIAFGAVAGGPDPAWRAEKRMFLQRLWEELQQLPVNQRAALLLNLKDAEGRGCIALFPATGIATLRQLADALIMNVDKFAELWNELPLEDARIAELLGLTRQQVINSRKSGRERLMRRLKGFI